MYLLLEKEEDEVMLKPDPAPDLFAVSFFDLKINATLFRNLVSVFHIVLSIREFP